MSSIRYNLTLATLMTVMVLGLASASINVDNIKNDVLHFSYELERWVDTDKRPCQDFFAYVCGKSVNTSQEQLDQQLEEERREFEKFLLSDNDEQLMDVELKVKQFYDACKNARNVDDLKNSFMYRMSGGWPAIDDAAVMIRKRRNMTWLDVLAVLHEAGLQYTFKQHIEIKSNKRVVYVQVDETMRYTSRKFEQLAGEVMHDYEVEVGRARLIALEILNFERNRREIIKADVPNNDQEFSYENFKLSPIGSAFDVNWDAYFKKILGKPLKPHDTVVVNKLPKVMDMFKLLQNTTMTRLLNWIWIDYLMDKTSNDCQKLIQNYFEPVYQHIVQHSAIDRVQMAQMYSNIGRAYQELLPQTTWIDEMSQQNSKQFVDRIIHLTLNGDSQLDNDYKMLTITKRNFYRNLEKAQRMRSQRMRIQRTSTRVLSSAVEVTYAVTEFMKIFLNLNALFQNQNLTSPLNYILVGERFAEHMIASGGSPLTPGAWRSMDSEREFAEFNQCIARNSNATSAGKSVNSNKLVLKLLANRLAWSAFETIQQQQKSAALMRSLDSLLAAGKLHLSLQKLYFIGSLLADCNQYEKLEQRELVHSYLKNVLKFKQAFRCRQADNLYERNICTV